MELREWTAAAADSDGGPPTADKWVSVEVPGSTPEFVGENVVAYRTTFADPRDGERDRALLTLRGLYAHARIWLNGAFVGSHDTYFTSFRTAFEPKDENELLVACHAPGDRFGGVFETDLLSPAESVPGIHWSGRVDPAPANVITDLTVGTHETDEGAGINAIVTVDAGTNLRDRIALSLGPTDGEGASALSKVGVTADAGTQVVVQGRLSVRDPERWWPRGFGSQNRYTVRAALGGSERTATTGFRTVEYGQKGLSVNEQRVPARGMVSLPSRRKDAADIIEQALEANANFVRTYGYAPPKSLYDAADEAGVLIFQDVPMNPGALDVERARLVARTLAGEYGHYPSLAAFGVHDDAYGFETKANEDGRQVLRATGDNDRAATATAIAAALPETIPTLPTTGLIDFGEVGPAETWVLDGYSGADSEFDVGTHTRYVVPGTDAAATERAMRAIGDLRRSGRAVLTVFAPPGAEDAEDAIETAFEPVRVFLADPTATETRIVVVNDTLESVRGELEWTAGVESDTLPVDVGPCSREVVGTVDALPEAPVELALSVDGRIVKVTDEQRAP